MFIFHVSLSCWSGIQMKGLYVGLDCTSGLQGKGPVSG